MTDATRTEQETKASQAEMFRLAEAEHKLSVATLSRETGINLKPYALDNIFARAKMPLWVFVALCRVLPDDLTSLMLDPAGKHVGSNEPSEGDLDALTTEASGLVTEVLEAKSDGRVTHIEQRRIKDRARRVASKARSVAA